MNLARRTSVPLAIGILALSLAACGSSSSSSSRATPAALMRFDVCLRQHGLPLPGPSVRGFARKHALLVMANVPRRRRRAALVACRSYLPKLTAAQKAKELAALRVLRRCMRAHGVKLPAPRPGPEGGYNFGGSLPALRHQVGVQKFRADVVACTATLRRRTSGSRAGTTG